MKGMDRKTGKLIDDFEHFQQSIDVIFTTPKGSRVMLRDFGTILPQLLDRPANQETFALMYAAIAEGFLWEPRGELKRVQATRVTYEGLVEMTMEILYQGQMINATKLLKL